MSLQLHHDSGLVSTVLDAGPGAGASLLIPGGDWLLMAEFVRQGPDLLLDGAGHQLLLGGYFTQEIPPDLLTETGAVIDAELAARLAGPLTPGQYAQAGGGAPKVQVVGTATKIVGAVEARHTDGGRVALKSGDNILLGDVVQTAGSGKIGITFNDGSVFSLGANGRMTIDEMVYDPKAAKGSEVVSVVSGAFSFISGQIAKTGPDAMTVKTPVATIGIRGTTVAGSAAPEGQPNTVSLLPDASGQVGQIAVGNQAGLQVLSQPGATTQMSSAFTAPPPPVILSPQQIQQQYGGALQVLPPPPTPQQLQQQQQQQQQQSAIEQAAQQAEATAAEQAAGEQAQTEKAAGEAEKALGEKLGAEKAEMMKMAEAAGLDPGMIGDILGQVLGGAFGEFGPMGMMGMMGDNPFGPDGMDPFGPQGDVFAMMGPEGMVMGPEGMMMGPDGMGMFGPEGPAGFDLGMALEAAGGMVEGYVNFQIDQFTVGITDVAISQASTTHSITSGSQTITPAAGVTDVMIGNANANILTMGAALLAGDSFIDSTTGDGDSLILGSFGPNLGWQVARVETVDLANATGANVFSIGSDGTTTIKLSAYADTISTTAVTGFDALIDTSLFLDTGNQTWTISNSSLGAGGGTDNINMGSGTDTLNIATAGTHSVSVIGVESITLANGVNTLTVNAPDFTGMVVTGGTGADTITLDGLGGTSTIIGGQGNDQLTGGSTANVFRYTATTDGTDTITDFTVGTGSTHDTFSIAVSGFTGADKFLAANVTGAIAAITGGDTVTAQNISGFGNITSGSGTNLFIFSNAAINSASALQTALQQTGGSIAITFGTAIANGGKFLAAYDTGAQTEIAAITIGGSATTSADATVSVLTTLSSVTDVNTLATADFQFAAT